MNNSVFFELLQVAVGTRDKLTRCLSDKEWAWLYSVFKRQSLVGIGFAGISRLPVEQRPSLRPLAQWIHDAEIIKEKNGRITKECVDLCHQLEKDGFNGIVLKGQSNHDAYPEWLREYRSPGDIDVWIKADKPTIVEYARKQARENNESEDLLIRFHHIDMPWKGNTDVEAHFMPMYFNNPFLNRKLQKFFADHGEPVQSHEGFPIPSSSLNVIYHLTHIYKHLFEEGIGLRQLLDYYFVLENLHKEQADLMANKKILSKDEITILLNRLKLKTLASSVMYIEKYVFAMPDEYLICEPNEEEGKWLLSEVLISGNFGKYDKRKGNLSYESAFHKFMRKTKHNFSLATHYPYEAIFEPPFRLYHFLWRKLELWKMFSQ